MSDTNDIRTGLTKYLILPSRSKKLVLSKRSDGSALDFSAKPHTVLDRFRLSPRRFAIRKELFRLFSVGVAAMLFLQIFSGYFEGVEILHLLKTQAKNGYSSFSKGVTAAEAQDFAGAGAAFTKASDEFLTLSNELSLLSPTAATQVGKFSLFSSANALLDAANHLSSAGTMATTLATDGKELPALFLAQQKGTTQTTATAEIERLLGEGKAIEAHLLAAENDFDSISTLFLPADLALRITEAQEKIERAKSMIGKGISYGNALLDLLGSRYPHSFLILLQNNTELRATGGFIGSLLRIDLNEGKITMSRFEDVYLRDGQLTQHVAPPIGLSTITVGWGLRDANYDPHFPTSVGDILWFWDHEKGESIDTVIAITPEVVTDILKLTGPIHTPSGITFSAENFVSTLSYLTEAKIAGKADPKAYIREMIEPMKEKISTSSPKAILNLARSMIDQKSIIVFSKNDRLEKLWSELHLDGALAESSGDYLAVIQSSLSGNKSDGNVSQKIWHKAEIDETGTVTDTVSIVRKHLWGIDPRYEAMFQKNLEQFGSGPYHPVSQLHDIAGEAPNKMYTRVYVPKGAELLSISGVDRSNVLISESHGKTIFGFFAPVLKSGEMQTIRLSYKLPEPVNGPYTFFLQKQSGISHASFHHTALSQGKVLVERNGDQVKDEEISAQ